MKTIADIIDVAINEHLWDGKFLNNNLLKSTFSCCAIALTQRHTAKMLEFLAELGCNTSGVSQFNEFVCGEKRQYARALWLTLAAMIANEEGK